jgi:hypothetical protein
MGVILEYMVHIKRHHQALSLTLSIRGANRANKLYSYCTGDFLLQCLPTPLQDPSVWSCANQQPEIYIYMYVYIDHKKTWREYMNIYRYIYYYYY